MLKSGDLIKQLNNMVFTIQLAGHTRCDPAWNKPPKQHQFHSFWFVSKGRGTFILDGMHHTAEPGKLFVIVPGTVFERIPEPNDPLEYYFVRFGVAGAEEEEGQWTFQPSLDGGFPLHGAYMIQNAPVIINLFEQLHYLWQRRGHMVAMRRKILFYELLLAIAHDFRSRHVTGNTTLAIEHTIEHMVNHYPEDLNLLDLAAMAGLSPSHYSRLFKKYSGHSPIDYLVHLRMDRAKELLSLSDYRLKAISQSVGYLDEFYFSRLFKKIVGMSPTDYARKHANQIKLFSSTRP
ncbi:MAG: AraC family transcriptional regulator [Paenibacillaceae bacterium]